MSDSQQNEQLPVDSFGKFGDVRVNVGGTGCGCLVLIGLFFSIVLAACSIAT